MRSIFDNLVCPRITELWATNKDDVRMDLRVIAILMHGEYMHAGGSASIIFRYFDTRSAQKTILLYMLFLLFRSLCLHV
jgi:hypothetical protein